MNGFKHLIHDLRAQAGYVFLAVFLVFAVAMIAPSLFEAEAQHVKKSSSGICHCPDGSYYDRTKNFTPYSTIELCLESGGRHPKRGQGDCDKAEPIPGSPEAVMQDVKPQSDK